MTYFHLHGECKYFELEDKREPRLTKLGSLYVHCGTCYNEHHFGDRFDRCDFCNGCPDFVFDRRKATFPPSNAKYTGGEAEPKPRGNPNKPKPVRRVDTGEIFPTIRMAAESVNRKAATLRDELRLSCRPLCRCKCNGVWFEFAEKDDAENY